MSERLRAGARLAVGLVLLYSLGGCALGLFGEDAEVLGNGEWAVMEIDPAMRFDYGVRIEGAEDRALEESLREASLAIRLEDKPPPTRAALARRADTDLERFLQALRAAGYYDGTVRYAIAEAQDADAVLTFTVETGLPYVLEDVLVATDEQEPQSVDDATLERIGLEIGQAAEAQPILDAEAALRQMYRERGHPFAEIASRRSVIDPANKTMRVSFRVDPGAPARFGEVRVEGLERVRERYVRQMVSWEPDAPYDVREVEATRRALAEAGVFERASVDPVEPVREDGSVDIGIDVAERPHRSIGVGVSYASDTGLGGRVQWEHRNLFAEGERLRAAAVVSQIEQGLEGSFRKPYFLAARQALVADSEVKRSTTDAFEEYRGSAFVGVERGFLDNWSATVGPSFDLIQIEESSTQKGTFALLGLRSVVRRDTADNPLDPARGSRIEFAVTPYAGVGTTDSQFVSAAVSGSQYVALDTAERFIVAGRARLGSIFGERRNELPPVKRFYAGGGGSIRGYEFQKAGPLDSADKPLGGRSVVELGLELRTRITDTIGLVPFVEGGNVYEETVPQLQTGDMLWGGGLGLRYFTPFGPVRFDIAVPLNGRAVDDAFQFYVSFGQAF